MHACGIDARQAAKEFVPDVETRMPRISRALRFRIFALSATAVAACAPVHAAGSPDSKPYDDKLMRLSEILGAVHYLRADYRAGEGQSGTNACGNSCRARFVGLSQGAADAQLHQGPSQLQPHLQCMPPSARLDQPFSHRRRTDRRDALVKTIPLSFTSPFSLPSQRITVNCCRGHLRAGPVLRPREGARLATSRSESRHWHMNLLRPQRKKAQHHAYIRTATAIDERHSSFEPDLAASDRGRKRASRRN